MKIDFQSYCDKVRACWIGKNIGGTMGASYEGTHDMLDIEGFVTREGEVLPNDDLDLQLVWLHALESVGAHQINANTLGEFWLNYIPPHWNEYGIGKANMRRGIRPPLSGDYENDWRNSNGAWIRTEVWACAAPALPELAVSFSVEDAKVDHGAGEGTYAAAFVSAMQCAAFALSNLYDCIDVGLAAIPADCRVAKSVQCVIDCYRSGKSWAEAREAVRLQNADLGDGWFEAPSNVGYAAIGMIYGEGDFKKSMITAINCGDDTDCTAATVGATMGILYGTAGIPADWQTYIGDSIVTISLAQGGVGRSFPDTCSKLTERLVALAPSVMYAHNGHFKVRGRAHRITEFGTPDAEGDVKACLLERIRNKVAPAIADFKTNTLQFVEGFLHADVTLSTADITPEGEVHGSIDFWLDEAYDNCQYPLKLRWILPEGFAAEGKTNALLKRYEAHRGTCHGDGHAQVDFVLRAGEQVSDSNRIILEVTSPGRHTAMYISFLLLG